MIAKEEVIEKVIALMKRKGAQVVRMNQLPFEAKINAKALKEHFKNKEEVFEACVNYVLQTHKTAAVQIEESTINPVVKVAKIYQMGLRELFEYHPSFFFHLKKHYRNLHERIEEYNAHLFQERIPNLLKEAQENGFILPFINLKLFSETQLSKSRLLIEFIYPTFQGKTNELNQVFLTNIRGILKKEYIHLIDEDLRLT